MINKIKNGIAPLAPFKALHIATMESFTFLFLVATRTNWSKINMNMIGSRSNSVECFHTSITVSVLTMYILLMQHTSLSPDRKVVVIVGDDPDGLLIDASSGKVFSHHEDAN
jgi:hypothetical protein